MQLVAHAHALLSVIDRATASPDAPAGARAIVTHANQGEPIVLTVYCGADAVARLDLIPQRALALGLELAEAARVELA